jgi:hypothetical protein
MTHRKGVLWIFGALAAVAVAVLLFLPFTRSGDRPEGAAHATLTQLSHLLEQWHQQRGTYPTDILEVGDLLASDIPVEARATLFTDSWGNPITYRFPSSRASCEFQLYSNGANGRDEEGAGDDVDTDSRGRRPGCE